MVMAFSRNEPYQHIAFDPFCINDAQNHLSDPDAQTSRSTSEHPQARDGFGSTLFRYTRPLTTAFYDPESGTDQANLVPARQRMYAQLERWMSDFHIDGIRIDSVENVANWDFIQGFKDRARSAWQARWKTAGLPGSGDDRFLVVGEELSVPLALLAQKRLDGLASAVPAWLCKMWSTTSHGHALNVRARAANSCILAGELRSDAYDLVQKETRCGLGAPAGDRGSG